MTMLTLYTDNSGKTMQQRGSGFYAWSTRNSARRNCFTVDANMTDLLGSERYVVHGNSVVTWSNNTSVEGSNMSKKEKFMELKIEKSSQSLKGVSGLITQSFEVESMTKSDSDILSDKLNSIGKGLNRDESVNEGNGWNNDVHHDVSLISHTSDNGGLYGTETSSSPIDISNWSDLKDYLNEILGIYLQASGRVHYTVRGSMHVHNTLSYTKDERGNRINAIKLDSSMVYHNIARFFLKFMPVMKWLVMTDKRGARGVRGSSYGDKFDNDRLFSWWSNYEGVVSEDSTYNLTSFDRGSCFRVMQTSSIHYENRLADCTFNSTHIGMWLSVNRAITLMGIDFARNGFMFNINNADVELSRDLMYEHSRGYVNVNRDSIELLYKQFVGYLAKYLKIIGALESIDVMDKLLKCPISQYLVENNVNDEFWNTELIEKVFNSRNRASDDILRDKFMHSVKAMLVPNADSLNDFLDNMSSHLDVEVKKIKSLYQMFKRENVDIEFLGGRLVYLGD